MATVVITGSTRGLGQGLALEFIQRGHNVFICSRNQDGVNRAAETLNAAGPGSCAGQICDVADNDQVQDIWDAAATRYGVIDFWINNAGTASARHAVHELPKAITKTLVDANLLGTIYGSQVAINGFRQQGHGALYNIRGGSPNNMFLVPNMGVYSSTKAAVLHLTKYLGKENLSTGIIVGSISPGTVITENWLNEQKHLSAKEWAEAKPIMNILCDHLDDVTPWLVDEVLKNTKSGRHINWLGPSQMLARFVNDKLLGRKRDMFSRYGL
jgi:NAD(P)-dependent dehydrogenase (short-subunit alcohol dehydrogenase family)